MSPAGFSYSTWKVKIIRFKVKGQKYILDFWHEKKEKIDWTLSKGKIDLVWRSQYPWNNNKIISFIQILIVKSLLFRNSLFV
jgi:hypothetical protein